jgi:twitching motility protein PilT
MRNRATKRIYAPMSLVPSLLQAIVRVDGEALVMHVGEKPYVVSPNGQVDLATRGLTFEAVNGIVAQLLPPDALKSLEDVGATQFELPTFDEFPGEHFTVTAARGGDDVWAEIRRRQVSEDDLVPADIFTGLSGLAAASEASGTPVVELDDLALPKEEQLWPNGAHVVPRADRADEDLRVEIPVETAAARIGAAVLPVEPVIEAITERAPECIIQSIVETSRTPAPASIVETPAPTEPAVAAVSPGFVAADVADERVPVPEAATVAPGVESAFEAEAPPAVAARAAVANEAPTWRAFVVPLRASEIESITDAGVTETDAAPEEASAAEVVPESAAVPEPVAVEVEPVTEVFAVAETASQPEPTPMPESVQEPEFSTPPATALSEAYAAAQLSEALMSTLPSGYPNFVGSSAPGQPASPVELPVASRGGVPPEPSMTPDVHVAGPAFAPFPPLAESSPSAVVLPIGRGNARDVSPSAAAAGAGALERLVRMAASRGASALFLASNSRPAVRLDGDIQTLDGAQHQSAHDIEMLLTDPSVDRGEALRIGVPGEWVWDLSDVGRVRCTSFRDHRGPGAVLRIVAARPQSVGQLGLSREIQALVSENEGLILVSGPRANGKSTLISSFVDLINRTRRDYVITIESEINIVHDRQGAFISQREVHGGSDELLAAARAALREEPDVLVLEDLRTPALMSVALDAAAAGQLIIGGVRANHASGAIDRLMDLYQPDQRREAQLSLSRNLRGLVTQVLLRKSGGGRVAAREVLLNTPLVASLLAEGRTSQLAVAIEGGRKHGMVPLNDALVGFVQSGAVDVREAYRRASDRAGLLDLLKRQGIDTSFVERLA